MEIKMNDDRISWYRIKLEKETLSDLNRRSDLRGLLQCGSLILTATVTGSLCFLAWSTGRWPLIMAAFLLHGTILSFLEPTAAIHELSHGTSFKNKKWNEFFIRIFSFLSWTNFVFFRTSHAKHHQLTLHTGRDLEIVLPIKVRPVDVLYWFTFNPVYVFQALKTHLRHARGIIRGEWEEHIFPESDAKNRQVLMRRARILVFGHLALAVLFIAVGHPILILIVQFPFYGSWLANLCGVPQHAGLKSDIDDFRYLCRTMVLSPIPAWLYWNMNYHTEHHMYPAVPFRKLPKLHRLLAHDMPKPNRGLLHAWKEIIAIQKKQKTDPDYGFDPFERS
jgi:fatty acid desaturase